MLIAATMLAGAWGGAFISHQLKGPHLRLLFGLFITGVGFYLIHGAFKRLGWL